MFRNGAAPASDGSALRAADATPSSPPQSLAVDSKRARSMSISRVRNATLGALLFQFSFPGIAAEVQKLGQKNDHQEQNGDRMLKEENDTAVTIPLVLPEDPSKPRLVAPRLQVDRSSLLARASTDTRLGGRQEAVGQDDPQRPSAHLGIPCAFRRTRT